MPHSLLDKHLVFSRIPNPETGRADKEYVQDRLRTQAANVAALLQSPATHIFICGLKGMEAGVEEALADIARQDGQDWSTIKPLMRAGGRYHVETY